MHLLPARRTLHHRFPAQAGLAAVLARQAAVRRHNHIPADMAMNTVYYLCRVRHLLLVRRHQRRLLQVIYAAVLTCQTTAQCAFVSVFKVWR